MFHTGALPAHKENHPGAELGSRVRGGKGGARFPGPSKLTTGGGGAIRNFFRKHLQGQTFPIRGGKVTPFSPFNRQIHKFTLRTLTF